MEYMWKSWVSKKEDHFYFNWFLMSWWVTCDHNLLTKSMFLQDFMNKIGQSV